MNDGLKQLRDEGIKWVEANKSKRFAGVSKLLTDLYPDNAHFIYELLQNAEDARDKSKPNSRGATVVRFTLNNGSLEFEHDGEGLFTLADVESITGIGDSNKHDDQTSIGKFGVGFKAVFAYTNTPEIHSGDFHFRIHDLVVPETDGVPRPKMSAKETRFIFPFDNPKKPQEQAVAEVERGLRTLGANTLMFLSHIRKIEYRLPDGDLGTLERIEHSDGRIEIHTESSTTHWLRFQKNIEIEDESGKSKACRIAIAYQLVSRDDRRVFPLPAGQVSIYFPAEKETSNLRFHIHAPFASTVARDSVRDCEANRKLRDHLAELVVESLADIRDQGMLTVGFLATLPNLQDNLPDFYEPIREAVVEAFKNKALTPTKSGSHAPASDLYRGPVRIQEVLDDDDLSQLTELSSPLWSKNPPQENQREARFLESLNIDTWGWRELAKAVSKPHRYPFSPAHHAANTQRKNHIENWIAQKDDAWLLRFYALLGEACDKYEACVAVDDLCMVRIASDTGNLHVAPGKAYFPLENDTSVPPSDVLFVKRSVYDTGRSDSQRKLAKSFLENTGVRPFDAKAGIEMLLVEYTSGKTFSLTTHIKHIRQFVRFWKQNPADTDLFVGASFLAVFEKDGQIEETCAPDNVCLDSPYEQTGLSDLYQIHGKHTVWQGYNNSLGANGVKDFVAFIKATGVMYQLRVEPTQIGKNPHWNALELAQDYKSGSGTKWTSSAISNDYTISNCIDYLKAKTPSGSSLLWSALVNAVPESAKAQFRPNKNYPIREYPSQYVCLLKSHSWIPDKSGFFRTPQDMNQEDLRTDFPYDNRNGLLTAIGFGENSRKRSDEYQALNRYAHALDFSSAEEAKEIAKLIKSGKVTREGIRALAAQHTQHEFPEKKPSDHRRERIKARAHDAPKKAASLQERSVQDGYAEDKGDAKGYLRGQYTNNGDLFCQLGHQPMPFKLINSEDWYFEAVECVSDTQCRYPENFLALSPHYAALFKYANHDRDRMRDLIRNAETPEIQVRLADGTFTLRFTSQHLADLQAVLEVDSERDE